jgi:hypothetical protein
MFTDNGRHRVLQPLSRTDRLLLSTEHGISRSYRIRERLHDGGVYRTFWFSDRDDAQAFLYAAITGSLRYEKELWRLPNPRWEPAEWVDVTYDFVTFNSITSTNAANQTFNVPADFNPGNNAIQCIGTGGAAGASGLASATVSAGGGGAGGWGQVVNAGLTPNGTATFLLNVGANGPLSTAGTSNNGGSSSNTWMRIDGGATAPANSTQGALGSAGTGGAAGTGTQGGGTGGNVNIGSSTNNGGNGGGATASVSAAAGGGGGAAGPNGVGGTATSPTNTNSSGGNGDNNTGGGGGGTATNGSNGTEIDTVHSTGAGGGGGGALSGTAGSGGLYGGGGGAVAQNNSTVRAGSGGQGLIVVSYTPIFFFGTDFPQTFVSKIRVVGY